MNDPAVPEQVVRCAEAVLMAADGPLSISQLETLLETAGNPDRKAIRTALQALASEYTERAVDLVEVAGGWRFQVRADYSQLIGKLWEQRPPRLSRALLETLALVCYRQPVSRGEIEQVRGVSLSSSITKTLLEYEWIKVVGYREVPGRPALFGTTKQFLDDFSLKSLDQLPTLPELRDLDQLDDVLRQLTGQGAQPAEQSDDAAATHVSLPGQADAVTPEPPSESLH